MQFNSEIQADASRDVRSKRIAALNYARGSVRLEGFVLSTKVEAIHQQYIDGMITAKERIEAIIRLHKK
jgi:hypothetical protein